MNEDELNFKEKWFEMQKERTMIYHEGALRESTAQFNAVIEYSKIAINGAFLLNGMAGVAIIYNMDRIGKQAIKLLENCAWGALAAIICAGISYIAQRRYAAISGENMRNWLDYYLRAVLAIMADSTAETPPHPKSFISANIISVVACIVWVVSLTFFFYAASYAFSLL